MAIQKISLRKRGSSFVAGDTLYPVTSWNYIVDKPSTYNPAPHTHVKANITDFPTSMPASDVYAWAKAASKPSYSYSEVGALGASQKAVDSEKLDGLNSDEFGRVIRTGDWHTFTDPLTDESGYIDSSWTNKFDFFGTNYIDVETSTDGVTFTPTSEYSDTQLKNLVGGDGQAGIAIPNLGTIGTAYKRFTFTCYSYVSLSQLYNYVTRVSGSLEIKVEKRQVDTWSTVKDFSSIGGWPAHCTLRHGTIWFNPSTTSTGHYWQVRITFKGTTTNPSYINHTINTLQWWGGYPAGRRNIYSTDSARNVDFPANIDANSFTKNGVAVIYEGDSRLTNSRPASDVYAWAKAASKPSYSWSEITSKPTTFAPSTHTHGSFDRAAGIVGGNVIGDITIVDGIVTALTWQSLASIASASGLALATDLDNYMLGSYIDATFATKHTHPYLSNTHDASNVTSALRAQWSAAYTHSQAAHAPSNANYYVLPAAASTALGGMKARVSGTTLYLRNDGSNA